MIKQHKPISTYRGKETLRRQFADKMYTQPKFATWTIVVSCAVGFAIGWYVIPAIKTFF